MEKIALDNKQMDRLKELGIDVSKASMCYKKIVDDPFGNTTEKWKLCVNDDDTQWGQYKKPAFNYQDVLYALPNSIFNKDDGKRYYLCIYGLMRIEYYRQCDNSRLATIGNSYSKALDAAYDLLCWCAENGHLTKTIEQWKQVN